MRIGSTRRDLQEPLGPLAGIPLAIKDNLCTKGVTTTCSSRMLGDSFPYESAATERLWTRWCSWAKRI